MISSVYAWDRLDPGTAPALIDLLFPSILPRAREWRFLEVGIGLLVACIWSMRGTTASAGMVILETATHFTARDPLCQESTGAE
jgi:hypothetical protein